MFFRETNNRQRKKLAFKPFPTDSDTILVLLKTFIVDRERQISTAKFSFDPLAKDGKKIKNIGTYTFTVRGTKSDPFKYGFDIPTYVYANADIGLKIPIPVQKIDKIISISGTISNGVFVDDVKYYDNVHIKTFKSKSELIIGKGIHIEIVNGQAGGQTDIKFTERGTLSDRIKDYEFWLTICSKEKKCRIVCKGILDGIVNVSITDEKICELKERFNYLKFVNELLHSFGVTVDLDMDKFNENDHKNIHKLFQVSRGIKLSEKTEEFSPLWQVDIANLHILIYLQELENGEYKAYNFFKHRYGACIAKCNEETYPTSIFLIMCKQNMIMCSNIDYENMYNSIISVPITRQYLIAVNPFLLEVICAYDEKKTSDLLDFAEKLSYWLFSNHADEINQLNYLQVIKRKRTLNLDERNKLRNIANNSDDVKCQMGACILLESFLDARIFWDNLTEKDINDIKSQSSFPIFNLWKEHKPEL
jgi:hypothetical protein